MPARETEAIILKTFPLGEADRLVSFFGRTSGRIRGVAGGARRLKNRYGSSLELLSHVKIWYVEKETRDLVRIQQCELLESFHKAQADYALSTGLAVVSEIAERVLPEQEVAEPMFREALMLHYLDDLDSKMAAMRSALASDQGEGNWTAFNGALERRMLRTDRFLSSSAATPETKPEPEPVSGGTPVVGDE